MHFVRIEDLRIDNDLTQQQVADYLHCHREVYSRDIVEIHPVECAPK